MSTPKVDDVNGAKGGAASRPKLASRLLSGTRSVLEILALLAVLAASVLIVKELWPRADTQREPVRPLPLPAGTLSLAGAPQKGSADALAVMIIYSDFQCPFCGKFARETLPQIEKRFVGTGLLALAFRNMPLEGAHPLALKAAEAGLCANRQDRFWQWHDAFFMSRLAPEREVLHRVSAEVGLDMLEFGRCVGGGDWTSQVKDEARNAAELGVLGTPTFVFGVREDEGGKALSMFSGSRHFRDFEAAIDDLVGQTANR